MKGEKRTSNFENGMKLRFTNLYVIPDSEKPVPHCDAGASSVLAPERPLDPGYVIPDEIRDRDDGTDNQVILTIAPPRPAGQGFCTTISLNQAEIALILIR